MLYLEDVLQKIDEKAKIANGLALLWSISSEEKQEKAKIVAIEAFIDSLEEDIEDLKKEIKAQKTLMGFDVEEDASE